MDCGQNTGDYIQTRDIICMGDDGSTGTEDQCNEIKPDTQQDCPETNACGIKKI